jgi:hypothetical protein
MVLMIFIMNVLIAYDDWREGYTLGYLCNQASLKLKELLKNNCAFFGG